MRRSTLRDYLEALLVAVMLATFVRTYVLQVFKIPSESMEDTLLVGDHILVNKFIYGAQIPFTDIRLPALDDPQPGDVIVFEYPEDPSKDFIKRVIGLPGDKIEIRDKKIYVNGNVYDDKHGFYSERRPAKSNPDHPDQFTVPKDHIFVMGDNRDHSYDSRFWGYVPIDTIKGKAFIIYWSWPNWGRFLHLIK